MKQKDQRLSVLRSEKRLDPLNPSQALNPEEEKQNLISVYLLPRKSSQQDLTNHLLKPSNPQLLTRFCLMKIMFFCSKMSQPKKNGSSNSTSQGSPASMRGALGPLGCSGRPGRPLAARRSEILRWVLASEEVRVGEGTMRDPPVPVLGWRKHKIQYRK